MGFINLIIKLLIEVIVFALRIIYYILLKTRLIYPLCWFVATVFIWSYPDSKIYQMIFTRDLTIILWLIFGALIVIFSVLSLTEAIIRIFKPDFFWFNLFSDMIYNLKTRKSRKLQKTILKYCKDIYAVYPDLKDSKEYAYIQSYCLNEEDNYYFNKDWNSYLYSLKTTLYMFQDTNPNELFFSFKDWWIKNRDIPVTMDCNRYYKRILNGKAVEEEMKTPSSNSPSPDWFKGVSDSEGLKKRYRDLLKIYHPDNSAGDTSITQQIQKEYDKLISEYS